MCEERREREERGREGREVKKIKQNVKVKGHCNHVDNFFAAFL